MVGLEKLPVTLLHGDLHGGNVIGGVVVDRGSARVGPATLDVTLAAGQSGISAYGEVVAGTALGDMLQLGTAWARVVNNAMFVGVVARRNLQVAADMVRKLSRRSATCWK